MANETFPESQTPYTVYETPSITDMPFYLEDSTKPAPKVVVAAPEPTIEPAPVVEETPAVESTPVVEAEPVVEPTPVETPTVEGEAK